MNKVLKAGATFMTPAQKKHTCEHCKACQFEAERALMVIPDRVDSIVVLPTVNNKTVAFRVLSAKPGHQSSTGMAIAHAALYIGTNFYVGGELARTNVIKQHPNPAEQGYDLNVEPVSTLFGWNALKDALMHDSRIKTPVRALLAKARMNILETKLGGHTGQRLSKDERGQLANYLRALRAGPVGALDRLPEMPASMTPWAAS